MAIQFFWPSFQTDLKEMFCMVLWALWYRRNMLYFQNIDIDPTECINLAMKVLSTYKLANVLFS